MPDIYPFDLVVFFEDCEPWYDCCLTLSTFQADVEVRGPEPDDWFMGELRYQRPSDSRFVPPASGSGLHLDMVNATKGYTGRQQLEDQVCWAIKKEAAREQSFGKAYRFDAGDVRREMEVA